MRCLVLLAVLTSTAHADDFEQQWPELPQAPAVDLAAVVAERVTDAGNRFFDRHLDRLSLDLVTLRIDAEQRRAKIAVGGGTPALVRLRVAGDVELVDGTARIDGRLALALGGKQLNVRLPKIDVAPASYRGERGVELRLPLLRRAF